MSKETDSIIAFAREFDPFVVATSITGGKHEPTSFHCRDGTPSASGAQGLAVDFDFNIDRQTRRLALARHFMTVAAKLAELFYTPLGRSVKYGTVRSFTVANHDDHVHVALPRGTFLNTVTPTEQEVRMIAIEPVGSATNPGGAGGWVYGRQGHVYAFDGAPFYGGWSPDQPGPENRSGRDCITLVPTYTGMGYWLVSDSGETYAYGDAPWPGNYNPAWGAGAIIGAFRNGRIARTGGLTLVRDDGKALNLYRLPA